MIYTCTENSEDAVDDTARIDLLAVLVGEGERGSAPILILVGVGVRSPFNQWEGARNVVC